MFLVDKPPPQVYPRHSNVLFDKALDWVLRRCHCSRTQHDMVPQVRTTQACHSTDPEGTEVGMRSLMGSRFLK